MCAVSSPPLGLSPEGGVVLWSCFCGGGVQTTIGVGCKRVVVCGANDYWIAVKRIVVRGVIHYSFALIPLFGLEAQPIRLLLRVGIKVTDEW